MTRITNEEFESVFKGLTLQETQTTVMKLRYVLGFPVVIDVRQFEKHGRSKR